MLWDMPPLQQFAQQGKPLFRELMALPGKKPTTLLYKYIDPCSLGQQCSYHGNLCSFADIPHIQLVGRRADGVFWMLVAQPYPQELRHSIAELASSRLRG